MIFKIIFIQIILYTLWIMAMKYRNEEVRMGRADKIVDAMKQLKETDLAISDMNMTNVLLGQIAICIADIADILESKYSK